MRLGFLDLCLQTQNHLMYLTVDRINQSHRAIFEDQGRSHLLAKCLLRFVRKILVNVVQVVSMGRLPPLLSQLGELGEVAQDGF